MKPMPERLNGAKILTDNVGSPKSHAERISRK
jgi:hypothetical protein